MSTNLLLKKMIQNYPSYVFLLKPPISRNLNETQRDEDSNCSSEILGEAQNIPKVGS